MLESISSHTLYKVADDVTERRINCFLPMKGVLGRDFMTFKRLGRLTTSSGSSSMDVHGESTVSSLCWSVMSDQMLEWLPLLTLRFGCLRLKPHLLYRITRKTAPDRTAPKKDKMANTGMPIDEILLYVDCFFISCFGTIK